MPPLTLEVDLGDWPGWIQALGALLALAVAVWIEWRSTRARAVERKEEAAARLAERQEERSEKQKDKERRRDVGRTLVRTILERVVVDWETVPTLLVGLPSSMDADRARIVYRVDTAILIGELESQIEYLDDAESLVLGDLIAQARIFSAGCERIIAALDTNQSSNLSVVGQQKLIASQAADRCLSQSKMLLDMIKKASVQVISPVGIPDRQPY